MIAIAAKLLIRMGLAMLILSLLIRPAISTDTGKMGDNLAIVVCLLVVITGLVGARIAKRVDGPLAKQLAKQSAQQQKAREEKLRR